MNALLDPWLDNPLAVGIVIIFLMISDLYLTRLGFRMSNQGYNDHFIRELYELNPLYQRIIHEDLPLPMKQIILRGLLGCLAMFILLAFGPNDIFYKLFAGAIILPQVSIHLTHFQNIELFQFIKSHPSTLKGQVRISIPFAYKTSRMIQSKFGILYLLAFLITNHTFFLGGFAGFILLFLILKRWEAQAQKRRSNVLRTEEEFRQEIAKEN